ncbi:MAG: hypothetical protein RL493_199 [Pseudomonadota bacterium]|jgi:hypothetical protein
MTETTRPRRDPNETPNYEQLMEKILLLTTELTRSNSLINSRIDQAEKNKEIASNIVKLIGPANYTSWLVMLLKKLKNKEYMDEDSEKFHAIHEKDAVDAIHQEY